MRNYNFFVENFKTLSGIDLSLYKERQMKRRINSYMKRHGISSYDSFLNYLEEKNENLKEFLCFLTINVSEFFRNPAQWSVLEKKIIPYILKHNQKPFIWSTACSTGEEPYTLAMIFSKYISLREFKILATDIDENVLHIAQKGVYNKKSLKNLPEEYLQHFEVLCEGVYKVDERLKRCIKFKKINLLIDPFPQKCDLIVSRNVLIYFTENAKQSIYKKFYDSLAEWGILFVGNTEQIIMSFKYGFTPMENFFYKKLKKIV